MLSPLPWHFSQSCPTYSYELWKAKWSGNESLRIYFSLCVCVCAVLSLVDSNHLSMTIIMRDVCESFSSKLMCIGCVNIYNPINDQLIVWQNVWWWIKQTNLFIYTWNHHENLYRNEFSFKFHLQVNNSLKWREKKVLRKLFNEYEWRFAVVRWNLTRKLCYQLHYDIRQYIVIADRDIYFIHKTYKRRSDDSEWGKWVMENLQRCYHRFRHYPSHFPSMTFSPPEM